MSSTRNLAILIVVVVAANYEAEAAYDHSAICQRLDDLKLHGGISAGSDADKYLKFAVEQLQYMRGLKDCKLHEVSHLRAALGRVLHYRVSEDCYADAFNNLVTIGQCNPGRFDSMKLVTEAARRLANKCLTPYITGKIETAIKGSACVLPNCLKGISVTLLIDHTFVEDYRKANKDDKWMDLAAVESKKTIEALYKSVSRELYDRGPTIVSVRDAIRPFAKYLIKYLYNPCSSFVNTLASVMENISYASLFIDGGITELLSRLNEETQESVFRYTVCKIFLDEKRPEKLAQDLSHHYYE